MTVRKIPPYLYVWHDVQTGSVVASGLRFADFEPVLKGKGGVLLLRHHFERARKDEASGLEYADADVVPLLARADTYSWGDFYWADYSTQHFPKLTSEEVSELLYFSTSALPKRSPCVESLANTLLVAAHDDGWYLRAFYSNWDDIAQVLQMKESGLTGKHLEALKQGTDGFWVQNAEVRIEERTFDVDVVINRNLRRQA